MDRGPDAIDHVVEQWHDRVPDLDASPLQVLGRVQRIAVRADPLLRPPFAEAGLAPGDFDVLAALLRAGDEHGVSPTELAQQMLVTPGAATKRVDRLVAAGLVTRGSAGTDRRAKLVALTEDGRTLTERLIRRHVAAEADLLADLTPQEAETLAALLRTVLRTVEQRLG